MEKCNRHILESLDYAEKLLRLARDGEEDSQDDGCRLLYCIIRDCAYTIEKQALREKQAHMAKGKWNETLT